MNWKSELWESLVAWKKDHCPRCGGAKSTVSKMCRACYGAATRSPVCPSCGGQKTYESKLCRACQGAALLTHHPCVDCGASIQRAATRCLACYTATRQANRPTCLGCGKVMRGYGGETPERCRPCNTQYRRSLPATPCSVDGCVRRYSAKGFCAVHYVKEFRPRRDVYRGSMAKGYLAAWPCQICGYNRMHSDIHRLVSGKDGGAYSPGNMVALCPRCHREVHRGLADSPLAPSEEEIIAAEIRRQMVVHD